jgi:Rps23 Pro-64 3,4-dihydroxylase Tpa1-like proline 4-hydroxylase
MVIKELHKDIYYIEDFFVEFNKLSEQIKNITFHKRPQEDTRYAHDDNQPEYYVKDLHGISEEADPITRTLLDEIKNNIDDIFHVNTQSSCLNAIKYRSNQGMAAHSDNNMQPNKYFVSSVYYPNEDYSGGEILFNDINLKIKPKENSLVLFSSDYIHESITVKDGIKISFTNFWQKISD